MRHLFAYALRLRDLTDATQGPHALQRLVTAAADTLTGIWRRSPSPRGCRPGCGSCRIITIRLPAIVTVAEQLAASATRRCGDPDSRYTRYVDPGPSCPVTPRPRYRRRCRGLAAEPYPDNLYVVPGCLPARLDRPAAHRHAWQLDLSRIVRTPSMRAEDLRTMIAALVDALLPG